MKNAARRAAGVLTALLVLVIGAVVVVTMTDWGRERVRLFSVEQLAKRIHGSVEVQRVRGNLLTGATLEYVTITDSAGQPFLTADTVALRYSLRSLTQRHLVFSDVRLVRPVVLFDRPPGGEWNVSRIFEGDTLEVAGDTLPGFGDWVRIEGMEVVDGTVRVRRPWQPEGEVDRVDEVIAPDVRERVVAVEGGWQSLSSFHRIQADFPLLVLADPDSSARVVLIDSLTTYALPFRPPAARVRQLSGRVTLSGDTLGLHDVQVRLPDSRLAVNGWYRFGTPEALDLRARAAPADFADLRFLRPSLPDGGGDVVLAATRVEGRTRLELRDADLRVEEGTVQGFAALEMGPGGTRVDDSDLTFETLDTRTVERVAGVDVPVDGVASGHVRLAGNADVLDVDGFATITERSGAVSRVEADGVVANRPGGIEARGLALRFDPLRMTLARELLPDVPLSGALTGRARLDGPLEGTFDVDADLVHVDDAGRSRVAAVGGMRVKGGFVARRLELRFDPATAALARVVYPELPLDGTFTGRARLDGPLDGRFALDADVVHRSPATGASHLLAAGEVELRDGGVAHGLRLTLDPVQAAAVRAFQPDFPLPGTLGGRATVSGPLRGVFDVDADLVHDAPSTGHSRVVAEGRLGLDGGIVARGLRFRLEPLQVATARLFSPDLPLDGTLEGSGTLDGALDGRMAAAMSSLTHRGSTGVTSLEGRVAATLRDGRIAAFDVDAEASPLSLATVGLWAPAAGLRGSVRGPVAVEGTPASATVDVDVTVDGGGGALAARGTVGLGPTAAYDLSTAVAAFDASAVTSRAPSTALSGTVRVAGVGTDPATARATVDAALTDSGVEGTPTVEETRVLVHLDDGLATFERGRVRLASATADVEGTFGLVAGRSGELSYTVVIDSLSRFREVIPADTGMVPDRPMRRARALAEARADSLRTLTDRLVASLAERGPPPLEPELDTVPPLARDSVSGALRAEGVLVGNLTRFDTRGTALLRDLVVGGAVLGTGEATYAVTDVPEPEMEGTVDADLEGVKVGGFAFDRVTARVNHRGAREGSGSVEVEIVQEPEREYALDAEYTLALDRSELRLSELALRFDTTLWRSTGPGAVRWAGDGIELEHVELVTDQGGRLFADGTIRDGGPAEMRLEVEGLQVADVAALLQDTLATRGLVSVDATLTGTLEAPRLAGTLAVDDMVRSGIALPAVRADFDYADRQLTASLLVADSVRTLLEGDVRLPVDLALRGREGPLVPDGPVEADLRLDSLPLQALPGLTAQLADPTGFARGAVTVRGTMSDPQLSGGVDLTLASVRVTGTGITLRDGVGAFRMEGQRLVVDSLVARTGPGTVRATGSVGLEDLRTPDIDLTVAARDATLLDDDRGDVTADADLRLVGTLSGLGVTGSARVTGGEIHVPEPERYHRVTRLDDPLLAGILDTLNVPLELRPGQGLLDRLALDVSVVIGRDTWLRNADLDLEIYTPPDEPPLRITSDPETRALVLEGTVNTDRGQYTFAGRELELTGGAVTFLGNPTPDPLLQLNARHEVPRRGREALVVLIHVGGYLSEPRLSLSSNVEPPVPESDLLSYLAFGRESASVLSAEGSGIMGDALGGLGVLAEQQLAGLGVGALTDALFGAIEKQGLDAGLDVFRAHPAPLIDEINYTGYFENIFRGMELEAGEYLNERFFLAARVRPSDPQRPGLRLEYETPSGFSWTARWEPQYRPAVPSLGTQSVDQTHVLGTLLTWTWRY